MPDLEPIDAAAIHPLLRPHLEPDEAVLWQETPPPSAFVPASSALIASVALAAGIALPTGLLDEVTGIVTTGPPRLLAGLILVGFGVIAYAAPRMNARRPRVYAITDRRLVVVRGASLFRSVWPEELRSFHVRGNIVYWRTLDHEETGKGSSPERRYPGFHGISDPQGVLRTLEDWRERASRRAEEAATAFLASRTEAGDAPDETPPASARARMPGARTVRHPGTGLTVDGPAGWPVTIRLDKDGPLEVFGVTLLKRVIRPGTDRPLESGGDWNVMFARGGPDAGIGMTIAPTPIPHSYDDVLNDRWSNVFNLKLLQSNPDVAVGEFRGFSLVRQMPEGAMLQMFGKVAAPVAVRQIWLGRHGMHVHFMGMARLDQHDVQRAVDAAVETLRVT